MRPSPRLTKPLRPRLHRSRSHLRTLRRTTPWRQIQANSLLGLNQLPYRPKTKLPHSQGNKLKNPQPSLSGHAGDRPASEATPIGSCSPTSSNVQRSGRRQRSSSSRMTAATSPTSSRTSWKHGFPTNRQKSERLKIQIFVYAKIRNFRSVHRCYFSNLSPSRPLSCFKSRWLRSIKPSA